MKNIFMVAFIAGSALLLSSCKDVMDKPLVIDDIGSDLSLLQGEWLSESESEKLQMVISWKAQRNLFGVKLKYGSSLVDGRLKISGSKESYIINVDLSSISYDGVSVFGLLNSRYALLGAYFDKGELVVVPADMEVFLEKFDKHLELKSEKTSSVCAPLDLDAPLKTSICRSFLSGVNVLSIRPDSYFNRDLIVSYNDVFPLDDALVFRKQK